MSIMSVVIFPDVGQCRIYVDNLGAVRGSVDGGFQMVLKEATRSAIEGLNLLRGQNL